MVPEVSRDRVNSDRRRVPAAHAVLLGVLTLVLFNNCTWHKRATRLLGRYPGRSSTSAPAKAT
jgi:hypothetical protein